VDGELRFYAAILGAYGILLLLVARDFATRMHWIPWVAATFFVGGVGRALSWVSAGTPHPFFLALMTVELLIPPMLLVL